MAIVKNPLFIKMKRHFTNSAGNHQRISYWTHASTIYFDADADSGDPDDDDPSKYFKTLEQLIKELIEMIEKAGTDVEREPGGAGQVDAVRHGGDIETCYMYVNGKGAVAESYTHHHVLWFDVIGTLPQADTTLTLFDDRIKEDSTVDMYTTIFGVMPKSMEILDGQINLTFKAQKETMDVKAKVWY